MLNDKKMKRNNYIFICLFVLFHNCTEQTTPKKEILNKDFNWRIIIPENFDTVSSSEWAKMQNRGADAVEKTFEAKVENRSKTIFVFTSDQHNYFESNYQPFDTTIDGNYLESCHNVNKILYETFIAQMPNIKIDTAASVEKIDGLDFQTFKMKVTYPNNMVLNVFLFSRLFGNKEFSVNIMYVDTEKGKLMLDSWKNSKFGRN